MVRLFRRDCLLDRVGFSSRRRAQRRALRFRSRQFEFRPKPRRRKFWARIGRGRS